MDQKNLVMKALRKLSRNKKNIKAWEIYYNYFNPRLVLFCSKLIYEKFEFLSGEINDIAHDILLKFPEVLNRTKFGSINDVERYLYSSCKNKIFDYFRKQKKIINIDSYEKFEQKNSREFLTPEDQYELESIKEFIKKIINELPKYCQKILYPFLVDELSLAEISKKYNIKKGSIYTQWKRCIEIIKIKIEGL
jgi:RNA polymerase sigma factor (sigma-70 family)